MNADNPLVTVITPTIRPEMLERCQAMFMAQDYPNKEMVVIPGPGTVGEKRNRGCEAAKGEIIVHFDDDDYYAPDYISKSVAFLLQNNVNITGYSTAYFCDAANKRAWLWKYADPANAMPYVCEASLVYRKSVWEKKKFKDISQGEGIYFLAHLPKIKAHNTPNLFVAGIHSGNTASQNQIKTMQPVSVEVVLNILNLYHHGG